MISRFILYLLILLLIASSCSSGNNVVEKGIFQKRKHNRGFYFAGFQKSKAALPKLHGKANDEYQEPRSLHQESPPVLVQKRKKEQYSSKMKVLTSEGIIQKNQSEVKSISNDLAPLVQVKSEKFNEGFVQTNEADESFWESYFMVYVLLLLSILGWLLLVAFAVAYFADLILLAYIALGLSLVMEIIAGYVGLGVLLGYIKADDKKLQTMLVIATLISFAYWFPFWLLYGDEISSFFNL